MQPIRKVLKLDKVKYYETHLELINCILPVKMTPTESQILAHFMSLEGDIAQYRFGPSAKKIIMEHFKLSPAGLSNHLSSLLKKGHIMKVGDMVQILPILMPKHEKQTYEFRLENQDAS